MRPRLKSSSVGFTSDIVNRLPQGMTCKPGRCWRSVSRDCHEQQECSSPPSLSAPAYCCCIAQDEKPAAEELDLSSMPIEDSYDGPMMEGKVSANAGG